MVTESCNKFEGSQPEVDDVGVQATLLEHNVRFGDPECQCLMMRLESDLLEAMLHASSHQLHKIGLQWSKQAALAVVLAAKGYPGDYTKGSIIEGVDTIQNAKVRPRPPLVCLVQGLFPSKKPNHCFCSALPAHSACFGSSAWLVGTNEQLKPGVRLSDLVQVFHAGTKHGNNGQLLADGGRVLSVTSLGDSIKAAHDAAYKVKKADVAALEGQILTLHLADCKLTPSVVCGVPGCGPDTMARWILQA